MTNRTSIPKPRITGAGTVTYRCHLCGRPLPAELATLTHIDGRLVAVHTQEYRTDGR